MYCNKDKVKCLIIAVLVMLGLSSCSKDREVVTEFYSNENFTVEHPDDTNIADLLQKSASETMVQLKADTLYGSGIIYKMNEEFVVIVTAAHVIENAENIQVLFVDGTTVMCSNGMTSSTADVGFLILETTSLPKECLETCKYVSTDKERFDELQAGDGIIVMGSIVDVAANAYEGEILDPWIYVEDFQQYMMIGKTHALSGMSGGGIFDQKGYFIGILCGGNEENHIAILPLSIIVTEYDLLVEDNL